MRRRRHSLLVCIKPRFISLLIDGATDSGNLKDEIFNVKFVDAKRGPAQRFLGIHDVRHANADGVLVTVDTGRQSLIKSTVYFCKKNVYIYVCEHYCLCFNSKHYICRLFTQFDLGQGFLAVVIIFMHIAFVFQWSSWPASKIGATRLCTCAQTVRVSTSARTTVLRRSFAERSTTSSPVTGSRTALNSALQNNQRRAEVETPQRDPGLPL